MIRDIWGQAWEAIDLQPPPHVHHRRRHGLGHRHRRPAARLRRRIQPGDSEHLRPVGYYLIGVFPAAPPSRSADPKPRSVRLTRRTSIASGPPPRSRPHLATMFKQVNVASDEHMYTWQVNGYRAEISGILKLDIDQGRFFTDQDDADRAMSPSSALKRRPSSSAAAIPSASASASTASDSPSSASSNRKCRRATTTSIARSTSPSIPSRISRPQISRRNLAHLPW